MGIVHIVVRHDIMMYDVLIDVSGVRVLEMGLSIVNKPYF